MCVFIIDSNVVLVTVHSNGTQKEKSAMKLKMKNESFNKTFPGLEIIIVKVQVFNDCGKLIYSISKVI